MNTVVFAGAPMPWSAKLLVACLAGLLLAVLSGRLRADGSVLVGTYLMACAAVTAWLHQLVRDDPGQVAVFGGFLVGLVVFLMARSRKTSVYVAITVTLTALVSLGLTVFLQLPPTEIRESIAQIRRSGGVVRQPDYPGDLWRVRFASLGIDDDQLLRISFDLRKLPKLWLNLSNCSVGDRGLAGLANDQNLVWLDLDGTRVTDSGLIHLSNLGHLEALDLAGTRISDDGLRSLSRLTNLKSLLLQKTEVTENGVSELQMSLNNCVIRYSE